MPKGMKQKPMINLKIEQKMKTAKRQKPMGNGKIEQKLQKAKTQRPMQKGKIKQKMKTAKKEEHSDEEYEDEEFEDKESKEDIMPTDRPPDVNTKGYELARIRKMKRMAIIDTNRVDCELQPRTVRFSSNKCVPRTEGRYVADR